jgi:hypothetical protein
MTRPTEEQTVEVTRHVADYRDARYPELFYGSDWVAVAATADQRAAGLFPDELEHGDNQHGPWVKLPKDVIERRVKIVVTGRWRGEEVGVSGPVTGDTVLLHYDGDPARARELGMAGDQRDGWRIRVPVDEVEVTDVTEREY